MSSVPTADAVLAEVRDGVRLKSPSFLGRRALDLGASTFDYRSRDNAVCGVELACDNIEVPACMSTCVRDN